MSILSEDFENKAEITLGSLLKTNRILGVYELGRMDVDEFLDGMNLDFLLHPMEYSYEMLKLLNKSDVKFTKIKKISVSGVPAYKCICVEVRLISQYNTMYKVTISLDALSSYDYLIPMIKDSKNGSI